MRVDLTHIQILSAPNESGLKKIGEHLEATKITVAEKTNLDLQKK